jgi:hypothetical protein
MWQREKKSYESAYGQAFKPNGFATLLACRLA